MFRNGKTLECPFTWEIEGTLSHRFEEDKGVITSVNDQPVIALMNKLTDFYHIIVKDEDEDQTTMKLFEVLTLRDTIDTSFVKRRLVQENISLDVLEHITNSSLYYFYHTKCNESSARRVFNELTDSNHFTSEKELATFHGCKSIVLTNFDDDERALIHARQAVTYSPDCPLWHLLLYKAFRGKGCTFEEWQNERNAILDYANSWNEPYYLVHAAQIYRDMVNFQACTLKYLRTYEARPEGTEVLLRLALGFVRAKKLELAGRCLDKLEVLCQDNTMFLHYKGNYLEALSFNEEAAWHYQVAAKSGNYGADFQYILCKKACDRKFDVIRHLNVMIIKYADKNYTQQTLLHLAMQYELNRDFAKACEHFIKAIRIDKQSYQLKKFRNRLISRDKKPLNIFHYVMLKFLPKCGRVDSDIVEQLRELCN